MLDPDAPGGTFTHWLVYGLRSGLSSLTAVPAGAADGVNDFGRRGYGGPCPPRGAAHHYHFVVLALDTRLGLAAGATRPIWSHAPAVTCSAGANWSPPTSAPDQAPAPPSAQNQPDMWR